MADGIATTTPDDRAALRTGLDPAPSSAPISALDAAGEHFRRGESLYQRRRIAEALDSYAQAVRLGCDPDRVAERCWMSWMLLGRFERAWAISDRVLRRRDPALRHAGHRPRHLRPVWDGSPLDGRTVLLRCHRGLGDAIQFVRYAPVVRRRARAVIVQAPPALVPLLAGMPGLDGVVPLDDTAPDPPHEVDLELMELPHALRTRIETIPRDIPYLLADPVRVAAWRRRLDPAVPPGALKVGLVWAAGTWKPERSIPLAQFARLNPLPGLMLIGLQGAPGLNQWTPSAAAPRIVNPEDSGCDIPDLAALILTLDLVITVDTMAAHLAGALGVPVWTLLDFAADWRWMLDRADTPWYPTMRLFRQPVPGDWATPMGEIVARLAARS